MTSFESLADLKTRSDEDVVRIWLAERGWFQMEHRVYGRESEPCLVCKTPIKRIVIAGRSSHYCPTCQK